MLRKLLLSLVFFNNVTWDRSIHVEDRADLLPDLRNRDLKFSFIVM